MAALSYGKRCLMAGLQKSTDRKKRKREDPDREAAYWCQTGLDKGGFTVKFISDYKGFGVFASEMHTRGDFLLEYVGERITYDEAEERERRYGDNKLFFFSYHGKKQCIDASTTQNHICQFVNDGEKKEANCEMRLKTFGQVPRLCLYAMKNISPGEELLYDYGDRNENLWWRNSNKAAKTVTLGNLDDDDADDDDPFDLNKEKDLSSDTDTYYSDSEVPVMLEEPLSDRDSEMSSILPAEDETLIDQTQNKINQKRNEDNVTKPSSPYDDNMKAEKDAQDQIVETTVHNSADQTEKDLTSADKEKSKDQTSLGEAQASLKKQRPNRMCIFCKKVITGGKLKRHIIQTHKKTHKEVADILNKSKQEQNKWFDDKRREGMYSFNMSHLQNATDLMRERNPKTSDTMKMCLECRRFFSNRTYYKHKRTCSGSEPIKVSALQPLDIHKDMSFVTGVLDKFRDGDVGNFIRQNKIIQTIGYKHFLSRNSESSKLQAVKKEVMMEMRELTRLFFRFQSLAESDVEVEDMYKRHHLSTLKEAMNTMCQSENQEKYGLKVNLNSVFQRSIKTLAGYYSEKCEDMKRKQLGKFQEAYKFCLPEIIGKARYQTTKNSLKKARLPKNLPVKDDIIKLKSFIKAEITHVVDNFNMSHYTWLRSLVVARLTLYNARRGEEGSRILVEEWQDAMNDLWVPKEAVETVSDLAEKFLIGQFKLAYLSGKGKRYVPVLIPVDLIPAVNILLTNRKTFGILDSNIFLFATKSSSIHCSGWHAVQTVCEAADVSVNATRNRHRASTVYASLDMNQSDRQIFLEHLGHEEAINKENYQCPPGLNEIRVMGKLLNELEEGKQEEERMTLHSTQNSPLLCQQDSGQELDCRESGIQRERKMKKGVSFRWTEEDTEIVRRDFRQFVQASSGNSLPHELGYKINFFLYGEMLKDTVKNKKDHWTTYRDDQYTSFYTKVKGLKPKVPWMQRFDDSLEEFLK